jgi:CspA family cold shock protein
MPTGTIARLLIDKGFGFIRDESGIEHFFHRSSVRGAVFELLREGQRVEFTPEESRRSASRRHSAVKATSSPRVPARLGDQRSTLSAAASRQPTAASASTFPSRSRLAVQADHCRPTA